MEALIIMGCICKEIRPSGAPPGDVPLRQGKKAMDRKYPVVVSTWIKGIQKAHPGLLNRPDP
jgi:hypothetical protein